MLRCCLTAVVATLLLVSDAAAQATGKVRTDAVGDSLPPQTIARFGKAKLPPVFGPNKDFVSHVTFGPNNRVLIGRDGGWKFPLELTTWDMKTHRSLRISSVLSDQFKATLDSADPNHVVYFGRKGEESCLFFDMATGKERGRLKLLPGDRVFSAGYFSPSGQLYVLRGIENDKEVQRIYSVSTGDKLCSMPLAISGSVCAFSPDDRLVAFKVEDGTIQVVQTAGGKLRCCLGESQASKIRWLPNALSFSPDGRMLAAWDALNAVVVIWDLATVKVHRRLSSAVAGYDSFDLSLAWTPDGRMLATNRHQDDSFIQLWEAETGQLRLKLKGHIAPVTALAFSSDGRLLASGSEDTTVLLWDVWAPH